jgi:hypothetical protein
MKLLSTCLLVNGLLIVHCLHAQEISIENIKNEILNCCKTGYTYDYRVNTNAATPLTGGGSLPKSYSLKSYCPQVLDQIGPTCASYATAYYGMTIYSKIKSGRLDHSPFNPIQLHQQVLSFYDECSIDNIEQGLKKFQPFIFLSRYGCDTLSKLESITADTCPSPNYLGDIKLDSWTDLNNTKTMISGIKKALATGNPVVVGISMNEFSFSKYKMNNLSSYFNEMNPAPELKDKYDLYVSIYSYCYGISEDKIKLALKTMYSPNNTQVNENNDTEFCWTGALPLKNGENGHAMCIIGYDDTKFGGAFEIVNSWGNDWANDGFIWIRYNDIYNMFPSFIKIGQ